MRLLVLTSAVVSSLFLGACSSTPKTRDGAAGAEKFALLAYRDGGFAGEGLPAVSSDGKTVLVLRYDGGEREGRSSSVLSIVDVATGRGDERTLETHENGPGDEPTPDEVKRRAAAARRTLADLGKELGKTRWLPMTPLAGNKDLQVAWEAPNLIVRDAAGKVLVTQPHPDWVTAPTPRCAETPEDQEPPMGCDCDQSLSITDEHANAELGVITFTLYEETESGCMEWNRSQTTWVLRTR